jgi:hypothetical protein
MYAIGYAGAAVMRRGPWLGALRPVNVGLSFVVVAAALFTHTPILDPLAWSAWQQYSRLATGKADAETFDYAALRFHLGRPGYDALTRLEQLSDHAQADVIRAGIASARLRPHYWVRHDVAARVLQDEDFVLVGGIAAVPAGLTAKIGANTEFQSWARVCSDEHRCLLFAVDLNADGSPEYCVVVGPHFHESTCWERSGSGWRRLGRMHPSNEGDVPGIAHVPPDLLDRLRAGELRVVPPRYSDIQIGQTVFRLRPD